MALKFSLVRASDGSKRPGYFGFAWSTLLIGPVTPLARRDFGFSLAMMSGEMLICAAVFMFDRSLPLLAARLFVVSLSWAMIYNELNVLNLVAAGYQFEGSDEVVSALEKKFSISSTANRARLLRERSLALVVVGLGCLQAVVNFAPQLPFSLKKSITIQIQPSSTPAATPAATPTMSPLPPSRPKEVVAPAPGPSLPSPVPSPLAQAPQVPKTIEMPLPPTKSAAQALADGVRECDSLMATQGDSDLPPGTRPIVDSSVLPESDIDRAIVSCDVARPGGRRFNTQLGRAYAAKAVLQAVQGKEADARDGMNKAIAQWNSAASQGSAAALNFLGAFYKGTFNSPTFTFMLPDYRQALDFWRKGAAAGNVKAARNAGGMLLLGPADFQGISRDIPAAKELLEKAIRGGDATAESLYGQALYYGYPAEVKKDVGAGLNLLIQACAAGDAAAKDFFDTEMPKPRKPPQFPAVRPQGC